MTISPDTNKDYQKSLPLNGEGLFLFLSNALEKRFCFFYIGYMSIARLAICANVITIIRERANDLPLHRRCK